MSVKWYKVLSRDGEKSTRAHKHAEIYKERDQVIAAGFSVVREMGRKLPTEL